MEKHLLQLALCALCFAVALTINTLDVHIFARAMSLFAVFIAGWGGCYTTGLMVGEVGLSEPVQKLLWTISATSQEVIIENGSSKKAVLIEDIELAIKKLEKPTRKA